MYIKPILLIATIFILTTFATAQNADSATQSTTFKKVDLEALLDSLGLSQEEFQKMQEKAKTENQNNPSNADTTNTESTQPTAPAP